MSDVPPTPDDLDDGAIPLEDLEDDEIIQVLKEAVGLNDYQAHAWLAMIHGDPHPGLVEVPDPEDA